MCSPTLAIVICTTTLRGQHNGLYVTLKTGRFLVSLEA
jgi:hypothetical protein